MENILSLIDGDSISYRDAIKTEGLKPNDVLRRLADEYEKTRDVNVKTMIVKHNKHMLQVMNNVGKQMEDEINKLKVLVKQEELE